MSDFGEAGKAQSVAVPIAGTDPQPHIVDQLIAERGTKIVHSRFWPVLRPFLHKILRYDEAVEMADRLAPLPTRPAMEYLSELLHLDLRIEGRENIPRSGGFVLAANHPTGIADGVAVYDALFPTRPDIAIFTNRDAVRVNPRLSDVLIPVEWREEFRNHTKAKETLRLSSRAFREGRAVVIFPSGRIAFWKDNKLNERPWQVSAVTLARKYGVPVLPVNVQARNSSLFYWFANWNTELRDMTVFNELLNKRGKTFRIRFGPMIAAERIAEGDPAEMTAALQDYTVHSLARDAAAPF
ncbi:Putative hemolysin [Faunimonas pinastri]|uniref:Putative hemolysin n=1 Tax=Faunimonas pinastri TaxID=1855383 RepID=A0A1H9JCT0_9HYPH|nr:1-acyl-sn-glycerol-3-phosphate acyltransferase [Faunimonas pinastri]SEQ84573.1 Putative hemolysin [Faunimonas pinastri]